MTALASPNKLCFGEIPFSTKDNDAPPHHCSYLQLPKQSVDRKHHASNIFDLTIEV